VQPLKELKRAHYHYAEKHPYAYLSSKVQPGILESKSSFQSIYQKDAPKLPNNIDETHPPLRKFSTEY
jgi:hypothetical protein